MVLPTTVREVGPEQSRPVQMLPVRILCSPAARPWLWGLQFGSSYGRLSLLTPNGVAGRAGAWWVFSG
jgi:hypothetical protein